MKRLLTLAACAALVTACSPGQQKAGGAAKADFNTDLPMGEYMGHVVDPAAFMYWKGSGTMIDDKGEHDLSPTTDEGWDVLVNGASILVEAGNTLQLPHRVRAPEADWNKYSKMLSERAMLARAAAERHDKQAVFDEGGKLYQVCVACHEQFIIEPQLEANGPAKGKLIPEPDAKKK